MRKFKFAKMDNRLLEVSHLIVKKGGKKMLINLNTLNKMFEHNPDKSHLSFTGCCQNCGRTVKIEIHHLPSGYGLSGGALYEPSANRLVAKCEVCYQINHDLEKGIE
jgi:hypothetical protein